jgi:hypothetical protein
MRARAAVAGGVVAVASLVCSACKSAPAEPPPGDAGYVRGDGGAVVVQAPSPTATVQGPLNSHLAQTVGMDTAAQRWGVHPKMATAWRMPTGIWRVTVVLQEPQKTANVYLDDRGAFLDGGVFGGEGEADADGARREAGR